MKKKKSKKNKYKSKFEQTFGNYLESLGIDFGYETKKIKYVKEHVYKCDFICDNNIYIETKGYFKPSDRTKTLAVKQINPEIDIRFVFMANNKIHKNGTMRYGDWCDKHNFKWCVSPRGELPKEWLNELRTINRISEKDDKDVRRIKKK